MSGLCWPENAIPNSLRRSRSFITLPPQEPRLNAPATCYILKPVMRRLIALHGCLAMLFALLMAPYQHVHEGQCDGRGSNGFYDDSTVVHAHPFFFSHVHADVFSVSHQKDDRTSMGEPSEEHASWWLNNSSLILHGAILPVVLAKSTEVPTLAAASFSTITIFDERGHDPPPLDCSVPRAPPA